MKLFAVRDLKANMFLKPFSDTSTANACRGFDNVCNSPDSPFNRFPDDFALMELGDFDPVEGRFSPHDYPQNLGSARSMLRSKPEVVQ